MYLLHTYHVIKIMLSHLNLYGLLIFFFLHHRILQIQRRYFQPHRPFHQFKVHEETRLKYSNSGIFTVHVNLIARLIELPFETFLGHRALKVRLLLLLI